MKNPCLCQDLSRDLLSFAATTFLQELVTFMASHIWALFKFHEADSLTKKVVIAKRGHKSLGALPIYSSALAIMTCLCNV